MNKSGSYIIEATVALPVMIIALVVMSSIILYYSCIEDAAFIAANELRRGAIEAKYIDSGLMVTHRIMQRIKEQNSHLSSYLIKGYGFREDALDMDEMIFMDIDLCMRTDNPIGIASRANYEMSLATRAYVGKIRDVRNMSPEEFMTDGENCVYIFPKDGEKYHTASCTYVKTSARSVILDNEVKGKYSACPLCRSGEASEGNVVYVFPEYGEAYHRRGCSSINRKYTQVELDIARERGYTPCSKCGG